MQPGVGLPFSDSTGLGILLYLCARKTKQPGEKNMENLNDIIGAVVQTKKYAHGKYEGRRMLVEKIQENIESDRSLLIGRAVLASGKTGSRIEVEACEASPLSS